ncbi:MAG: right-handed parallel beta-helix repeat-containing protein [Planctomycetes bacterium]|nr:right-handed parallel beta-helix repeat-containing protein [Planctomycetota bacterium]
MRKLIYWVILVVLVCAGSLSADTYYVDDSNGNEGWNGTSPVYVSGDIGPFKTIGRGMQYTDNGDIIIVADGIYYGQDNLELNFDEDLTLKSANGPNECILDFYDISGWDFNNDVNTLISGFSIKGITQQDDIYVINQSRVEFKKCIFTYNTLGNDKSLILCDNYAFVKLNNCVFKNNLVGENGLIRLTGQACLEVYDSEIIENTGYQNFCAVFCTDESDATIINTSINSNWIYGNSGNVTGITCKNNSNVAVDNCEIKENYGERVTGIYFSDSAQMLVKNSEISGNSGQELARGLYGEGDFSKSKVENCIISGNTTVGIIVSDCNSLEVTNCLISNHFYNGVFIGSNVSTAKIKNCTIVNNRNGWAIDSRNHFTYVENCIIKDNGNNQINGGDIIVSYSDISDDTDHIWPGVGNINADPLFADANNSDYHLLSQAGRWDSADELWVRDDVSSPCIASGDPADWIGDEPAGNGGRINMGYFGGTSQASKADYCVGVMPGDVNRDCLVNFIDFALMTSDWLGSTIEQP